MGSGASVEAHVSPPLLATALKSVEAPCAPVARPGSPRCRSSGRLGMRAALPAPTSENLRPGLWQYRVPAEIIQNNIYGVDIDPFVVNSARLWLLLLVDCGVTTRRRRRTWTSRSRPATAWARPRGGVAGFDNSPSPTPHRRAHGDRRAGAAVPGRQGPGVAGAGMRSRGRRHGRACRRPGAAARAGPRSSPRCCRGSRSAQRGCAERGPDRSRHWALSAA